LIDYITDSTTRPVAEYIRGNLRPKTPNILHESLQRGGRPTFKIRLTIAATMSSIYGIYSGYELCENVPREPGSEEYLNSEKYEIKHWDLEKEGSLREFIARVNRIRRENRALQSDRSLRFHPVDNPEIIAFSKRTEDPSNVIVA